MADSPPHTPPGAAPAVEARALSTTTPHVSLAKLSISSSCSASSPALSSPRTPSEVALTAWTLSQGNLLRPQRATTTRGALRPRLRQYFDAAAAEEGGSPSRTALLDAATHLGLSTRRDDIEVCAARNPSPPSLALALALGPSPSPSPGPGLLVLGPSPSPSPGPGPGPEPEPEP
eukprot:2161147-Prymnesium_polylepis.1